MQCKKGDLDLARPGDGRWRVEWTPVDCAVGGSFFQYAFEGSNSFYLKVRVLNARIPTAMMSAEVGGIYQNMTATRDNAFILSVGGPFAFPMNVQLTSVQGDVVDDMLASGMGTVQGSAQFPPTQGLGAVNLTPSAQAGIESGQVGQVQACNVTLEAFSACGGTNLGVGDAQIPGSCCPEGFSCVRQNSYYHQCVQGGAPAPSSGMEPGSGMEAPVTAPASEGAPSSPPPLPQASVLCQLVQDLLHVPNLAKTCKWSVPA